jgi:hypothetical protein
MHDRTMAAALSGAAFGAEETIQVKGRAQPLAVRRIRL